MEQTMAESPNYYAILTADVRYDKRLTANAKLLYSEITALCEKNGACWATNKYFSQLYDVSVTSISKWISLLKKFGYIDIEFVYKEGSREIAYRYLKLIKYPFEEKLKDPIEEKLKDNITSINTTSNNNMSLGEKVFDVLSYFNNCSEINSHHFKKDKKFKVTTKNKEAVKLIKARFNDGFTLDDFKDVIFIKYMDFVENEYQIEGRSSIRYYCPETLFASKHFSKYKQEYDSWSADNE